MLVSTTKKSTLAFRLLQNIHKMSSYQATRRKVFVQSNLDKQMMRISFQYDVDGRTKSFNLLRQQKEPLSSSLERIKLNLIKLNKKNTPEKDEFRVGLSFGGEVFDATCVENIDAWIDGAILEIEDQVYEVDTDSPLIESMKLPSCVMKDYIVMPSITLTNCTLDTCKFKWYRKILAKQRDKLSGDIRESLESDGKNYWLKISEGLTFCPTDDDVACQIKLDCTPSDGFKEGPNFSIESSGPVQLGPTNCPFEKRHQFTRRRLEASDEFRVISYNILADLYADSDYSRTVLFSHCPSHSLDIEYRKQLLLKEVSGYNADLICLQEVDKKEFERTYDPYFKHVENFSCIFNSKGGQVGEGCATLYRNDKFKLINSHKICLSSIITANLAEESVVNKQPMEYHPFLNDCRESERLRFKFRFNDLRSAIESNKELKKRFMDRHTIIQTTLLKLKGAVDKYIIVANTHLYFAPDADHIRLLQGCVCVRYMEYIMEYYKCYLADDKNFTPTISTVFCGDMNSTPDCGLYRLVTNGHVPSDLPDWSSNEEESVVNLSVDTRLRFSSAYENIEYTNYTMEFNGCLDYIYYDPENLTCMNTVPLPDHEDVTAIGGLPSDVFPSDHLALIADLKYS